jgi:uncharacterized short protein YbdD (DUF466 family)
LGDPATIFMLLVALRRHHPNQQPISEREFHRWANDEKYGSKGVRRCC